MGVCMCGFFNVWVCVCVGFVMCGFVYVWICVCEGFVMWCVWGGWVGGWYVCGCLCV